MRKPKKNYRQPVNFTHMSIYVTNEQRDKLARHTETLSVGVAEYIRTLIDKAPEPVAPVVVTKGTVAPETDTRIQSLPPAIPASKLAGAKRTRKAEEKS